MYSLEFSNLSGMNLENAKYKIVSRNVFKNFKIKSLTLRGLNLENIDSNAFGKEEFSYLDSLDLSLNKLERLDSHALSNLQSLEKLVLANNKLAFDEHNFQHNPIIKYLDLSNNKLQYLTPNLFSNLKRLETIDLSNNNINTIQSCTFDRIQVSPISRKYSPTLIKLNGNPILCDCNLFYLSRHLNYRLNLTCAKPKYYEGIDFDQLRNEDPSVLCKYEYIQQSCEMNTISKREITLIVVLSSVAVFFLLCACCCCCKSMSKSSKIELLKNALKNSQDKKIQHEFI